MVLRLRAQRRGSGALAGLLQRKAGRREPRRKGIAVLPERLVALGLPAEGDRQMAEDKARAQKGVARRQNRRRKRQA